MYIIYWFSPKQFGLVSLMIVVFHLPEDMILKEKNKVPPWARIQDNGFFLHESTLYHIYPKN